MNAMLTQSKMARPFLAAARCLIPAIFCLLLTGCGPLGYLAEKLSPEPTHEPEFKLKQEPLLVLVESYQDQAIYESAGDELAETLSHVLKKNKVVPMIPSDKLLVFRTKHADSFANMPIQTIGREMGAKQVLYVNVKQLQVSSEVGSDVYGGDVDVQVSVIDVSTGEALWPTGTHDGYSVHQSEPALLRKSEAPSQAAVQSQMLEDLADQIAELFYEYTPDYDPHKSGQVTPD